MRVLLDTGILLRLANEDDALHQPIVTAVAILNERAWELKTTTQNVAELWNVATRPVANNGQGMSIEATLALIETVIEPACSVLNELPDVYPHLKRLGATYGFRGKQVHDARLVAMMLAWQIDTMLTLNDRDFSRYEPEGITVLTPERVAAAQ